MVTHKQYKSMASLPLTTVTTAYSFSSSTTNLSSLPSRHFFVKPRQCLITGKRNHRFQVSCKNMHGGDQNPNANSNNNGQTSVGKFDRRNVLLGLGGLYGAANLVLSDPSALAAPVQAPDIAECHDVSESDVPPEGSHCCPPTAIKICDYELPKFNSMRTRRAAHEALVDQEYLAKFSHGIELLKNLPAGHPHNFMQQANVHCAYCNGAYYQVGFPGVDIQVHFSWLFFPFHRWYLYFFERIMAKHLKDETFALPFWNWDAPDGMTFPPNMVDPKSPLYDALRNPKHLSPTIIDLGYGGTDTDKPDDLKIKCNLSLMHTQMVKNSSRPLLFLGGPYYAGDSSPGPGSIERSPHNQVHNWVGTTKENFEDMGNFYSAARDPVFYMHHANIDRMWTIRNTNIIGSRRHTNFMDPQWLNASFVFYDEDEKPVRVKVGDCRDNRKLGYEYEDVPRPWEHFKPVPRVKKSRIATTVDPLTLNDFPIDLSKGTAKFLVNRPRRSRTVKEKDDEEEVLVIGGIKFHSDDYVVFDVFVNTEDEAVIDKCDAEYASTFSSLPHKHNARDKRMMTYMRIGLNQILEDLEAEGDDKVLVSLVPQSVGKGVHILAAHIEFMA